MTKETNEKWGDEGTVNEGYESEEENPLDSISKTVHLIKFAAGSKPYFGPGSFRYNFFLLWHIQLFFFARYD
jgi:hypothetical protein